jgi:hypothetical protein
MLKMTELERKAFKKKVWEAERNPRPHTSWTAEDERIAAIEIGRREGDDGVSHLYKPEDDWLHLSHARIQADKQAQVLGGDVLGMRLYNPAGEIVSRRQGGVFAHRRSNGLWSKSPQEVFLDKVIEQAHAPSAPGMLSDEDAMAEMGAQAMREVYRENGWDLDCLEQYLATGSGAQSSEASAVPSAQAARPTNRTQAHQRQRRKASQSRPARQAPRPRPRG